MMLSEVVKLLQIALTIPVTSAIAERTFSSMRRLKNYLRSSMTQKLVNNLMLLHVHKDKTDEIDLHIIAEQFVDVNERKRNFFAPPYENIFQHPCTRWIMYARL